jgi:hypothetical protein
MSLQQVSFGQKSYPVFIVQATFPSRNLQIVSSGSITSSRCQSHKTFYDSNLQTFVFVPGRLFQPSLLIAAKDGAYPSEAPFSCYTLG